MNNERPRRPRPSETLLLLVIPLSQTNLPTQHPPLCNSLLLHHPRDLSQLGKIPLTIPTQLSFSSPLLGQLITSKVTLCDEIAVYRDLRTGDCVHEGVDKFHENRYPEGGVVDEAPAETFWEVGLERLHGLSRVSCRVPFGDTQLSTHQFGMCKGGSLGGRREKVQHRNRPTANDSLAVNV